MIALSEMIERRLSIVGKVSGSRIEKRRMSSDRQDDQAIDRREAVGSVLAERRRGQFASELARARWT